MVLGHLLFCNFSSLEHLGSKDDSAPVLSGPVNKLVKTMLHLSVGASSNRLSLVSEAWLHH